MDRNLQPYSAYKDSGVPWLGEVPVHWEVRRTRSVAEMRVSSIDKHTKDDEIPIKLCNYVDVYKRHRITEQVPFMNATASEDEIERFRLRLEDVLITKDSEIWNDIGVPALVEYTAPDLICGYHLALLRSYRDRLSGGFLFRVLQAKPITYQFHIEANGVTRFGLSHEAIKSIRIPIPPLLEQLAIVRYLDYMDRRIGKLILAKQKLIKLLEEQKQAIIHRAVTRGLDPNVRLKPSGVEWLGDVPEHWEVTALRRCASTVKTGGTPSGAEEKYYDQFGYNWFTPGDFKDDLFLGDSVRQLSPLGWENVRVFLPNTIMMIGIGATIGKASISRSSASCNQQINAIIPADRVLAEYLALFLRSIRSYVISCGKYTTLPIINQDDTKSLPVALPSLSEQSTIVQFVQDESGRIGEAIDSAQRGISLLREYRTRLISDVVTGKLDVRDAAAGLPEEVEEEEAVEEYDESVEEELQETASDEVAE